MSPPGRPKGEYRRAQPEGTPASPRYTVRFAPAAEEDLIRLVDHLLDRAQHVDDLVRAEEVIAMLRRVIDEQLGLMPWSYRKAGDGRRSTRRELIVPSGKGGYMALFEIESDSSAVVLAVRHLLESDYH